MRNTARNRNNRMRLQKIRKRIAQRAKQAKKAREAGTFAPETPYAGALSCVRTLAHRRGRHARIACSS